MYQMCHSLEASTVYISVWNVTEMPCRTLTNHRFERVCLTDLPMCHIYASVNWISIGSDNGLSPIWTSAWLVSIGPLETNFSEILIKIWKVSFTKMHLKITSAKRWPFCPGGGGGGGLNNAQLGIPVSIVRNVLRRYNNWDRSVKQCPISSL